MGFTALLGGLAFEHAGALLEILRPERPERMVDADMKKPGAVFPHRKSNLPDLRTHKKTDLRQAEIGAHLVSLNFPNRPFR